MKSLCINVIIGGIHPGLGFHADQIVTAGCSWCLLSLDEADHVPLGRTPLYL
jgi:hypothetical protein